MKHLSIIGVHYVHGILGLGYPSHEACSATYIYHGCPNILFIVGLHDEESGICSDLVSMLRLHGDDKRE